MQMPALIATPAFQSRTSMPAEPVVDGVELYQADENEVDGDNVIQQARDEQNEYPGDNGDERRDMGGGDDHDFSWVLGNIE
jgi:hypothetical protein